jgi:LytS/YehU family sensor histidine kinase
MAYPGIYIAVALFIMLIRKITSVQMTRKQELKQKLVTLQLQSVRAQLDPHFTFNTLNSVAALIYLQDKQTAYEYMNKFTRLLRSMIEDADRIYRNLKEELDFVTTYLELEKLRFGDQFDFSLELGEGISGNEQVPKLVLHTYAENAVKHGLMPRLEGGLLKIVVVREGEYLRLSVEDNGVGRSKSQGQSPSTGKGLKLANEFYSILNQINTKQISHRITDLFDNNGMASGTVVEIIVPVEL